MATAFLNRFQRDKSERQVLNENNNNDSTTSKEKIKSSGGFSLALSRSTAALTAALNKSDVNGNNTSNKPANTQQTEKPIEPQPRQQRRYIRSATAASVTQLLSEGCNNLLQRFRRNPSERPEKKLQLQQQQQQQKQLKNW